MKRFAAVALLLALLPSLAACAPRSPQETAPAFAPQSPGATTEPRGTTTPASQTTAPRRAEDLVEVRQQVHLLGADGVGNTYDYTYTVPGFTLDSQDAAACNQAILETCTSYIEESQEADREGYSVLCMGIGYDAWLWEEVLTLLVTVDSDWGNTEYLLYQLDADTGARLQTGDLAARLGLSQADFAQAARAAMESTFRTMFQGAEETAGDFYQTQLDKTVAGENVSKAQLYLGEGGAPFLLCTIYSLAGAESYDYCIPLELPESGG